MKSNTYAVSVDPQTGTIYLTDLHTAFNKVNLGWHLLNRCATLPQAEASKKYWEKNHGKLTEVLESITIF